MRTPNLIVTMPSKYISKFLFLILFLVNLSCLSPAQKCHHNPVQITSNDRVHVDRPQTQSRILSPDRRMKFHVEYHSSVMEHPRSEEVQGVVAEVLDRVSRTLSVKQEAGYFLFKTYCERPRDSVYINGQQYCTVDACSYSYCGEIMAPETLSEPCFDCDNDGENCAKTGGPPIDREPVHYTLFVASRNSSCRENFIGYSYACRIDDTTDRPIAGVINICPSGLELDRRQLLDTIQHEMFHVLGFTSSMYGLYRDENGNPLTPREANGLPALNLKTFGFVWSDRVIQNFTLYWEHNSGTTERSIQAFVLPNVLREARAHFGCPGLMGVELEDGGGYGTAMSHFEKRILATESMNGMLTPVRVFSRITLAVMEDTGWYTPDYSMADKLNWGKDLGCDFVQKSCKNWIDTRIKSGLSPSPWCTKRNETGCHAEGTDAAVCKIGTYDSPIPNIYQMFTEVDGIEPTELSRLGGNRLADYCPFFEVDPHSTPNQSLTDLHCTNTEIIDDCRNSKCVNGGVCRDVMNGYYCDCPVGYAGAFCDHVNLACTMDSDCQVNEVCSASHGCECVRNRIRDHDNKCMGVTDVQEYTLTIRITEVNGVPAVYQTSLTGNSGEGFRHNIEYEIRQILRGSTTLRSALLNVVTRNIYSGSIIMDLSLIFLKNSSSTISLATVAAAATLQDSVLRNSGTAYNIMADEVVVQDTNECEDGAGNDCSPHAQCTNTDGSYMCSCLSGFEDTGGTGALSGRECTDIDECLTTSDIECSLDAECLNTMGSYTCHCHDGYDDDSPDGGRPGRLCYKQAITAVPGPSALSGLSPVIIISLSVGLGIFFLFAVLFIYILYFVWRRKAKPMHKDPSNLSSLNNLSRQHTTSDVYSIPVHEHHKPLPRRNQEWPHPHPKHDRPLPHHNHVWPNPHRTRDKSRYTACNTGDQGSSLYSSMGRAHTESTYISTELDFRKPTRGNHEKETNIPHKSRHSSHRTRYPASLDNYI